jgi:TonB family protein
MSKKTVIALIFIIFSYMQQVKAQTPIDCGQLKTKIDNAFKDSKSIRIGFSSRSRKTYIDYEQDSTGDSHLVYKNTGKSNIKHCLIKTNNKKYFTQAKETAYNADINWSEKAPSNFNYEGWIDSCKSAQNVFNQPFTNCSVKKNIKVAGTSYSIFNIEINKDTFEIWLNRTTSKVETIEGTNKQKDLEFDWTFDVPFKIQAPSKDHNIVPYSYFPPSYSYNVYDGSEPVYVVGDKNAEFKGGVQEMFKMLAQNVKYPEDARIANKEGTVYIGFVVEKDGTVSNITLKRGFYESCNEEAIRVVKLMNGEWEAGLFHGQKIRMAYTLPVKFKLTD